MQNEFVVFQCKAVDKVFNTWPLRTIWKKGSCHRKDITFSLFILNSSVTAICLFSCPYMALLNYSILKPRRVNHNVDKTKLQYALISTDFGILRPENTLMELDSYRFGLKRISLPSKSLTLVPGVSVKLQRQRSPSHVLTRQAVARFDENSALSVMNMD